MPAPPPRLAVVHVAQFAALELLLESCVAWREALVYADAAVDRPLVEG